MDPLKNCSTPHWRSFGVLELQRARGGGPALHVTAPRAINSAKQYTKSFVPGKYGNGWTGTGLRFEGGAPCPSTSLGRRSALPTAQPPLSALNGPPPGP